MEELQDKKKKAFAKLMTGEVVVMNGWGESFRFGYKVCWTVGVHGLVAQQSHNIPFVFSSHLFQN